MSVKVALFANKDSKQINEIAEAVKIQGAEPLVFDIQIGGANTVLMTEDSVSWNGTDFSDINAIHIRCTSPRTLPTLPPVLNDASYCEYRAGFLREQEYNAATHAFFEHLSCLGKLVVNPLTSAYLDHDSKSQLYAKLDAWGFLTPRSLMTTCPDKAGQFLDEVGEAIVKPAIGVGSTRMVTDYDKTRLDELRLCPTLFQERIKGDTIRIHIVGDKVVLALRILSGDFIDSRTSTKGFEYIKLSDEEEKLIVSANRKLGLHYAAWDVLLREDGKLVYVDCNPGPFVMWIGEKYRNHVFTQLASYLIGYAETNSVDEATKRVAGYIQKK